MSRAPTMLMVLATAILLGCENAHKPLSTEPSDPAPAQGTTVGPSVGGGP